MVSWNRFDDGNNAIELESGGATNVDIRNNLVLDVTTGIELAAPSSGFIRENNVGADNIALVVATPFTGRIEHNAFHDAAFGVAYNAAAELSANDIRDNGVGVTVTPSGDVNGFGFVGNTLPNRIHNNGVGVSLTGWMQNQHVFRNTTGVQGTGQLGGEDLAKANLIENNSTGINVSGTIQYNKIARNGTGISARSNQLIAHNIIYRNDQYGILLVADSGVPNPQQHALRPAWRQHPGLGRLQQRRGAQQHPVGRIGLPTSTSATRARPASSATTTPFTPAAAERSGTGRATSSTSSTGRPTSPPSTSTRSGARSSIRSGRSRASSTARSTTTRSGASLRASGSRVRRWTPGTP